MAMSDFLELPLKPEQETFMDEPQSVSDVNIHDLVIDIQSNSKNINKLHIHQAIAVFLYTLEDIIKLQQHSELFRQFRSEQIKHHSQLPNKIDDASDNSNIDNSSTIRSSPMSSPSPPSKVQKVHEEVSNQNNLKNTTPDSLSDDTNNNPSDFLTLEELLETTDLDKSYEIDFGDISSELIYYQDPKIISQNEHVLKGFNLVKPPNLSIEKFLERIKTYSSSISALCYIHAACLIFKLCIFNQVIKLDFYNVYRLILALLRCLTKKLEDIFQKQKTFATVGGVSLNDLLKMEVGFLFLCNFKLVVNEHCLNDYLNDFASLRTFVKHNIDDQAHES